MTLSCDLETGLCKPTPLSNPTNPELAMPHADIEFIYVGDPMCSWCWGISDTVKKIQQYTLDKGIFFSIILGGLRPGGGDIWNEQFKSFLRNEWQHIQKTTEQPFSFKLLERKSFNYDTEPACRAVTTARKLLRKQDINDQELLSFFSKIQKKFYVDGGDPTTVDFYRDLCESSGIDYTIFAENFAHPTQQQNTYKEFQLNRSWGIQGFPSFALRVGQNIKIIASGHIQLAPILTILENSIQSKH